MSKKEFKFYIPIITKEFGDKTMNVTLINANKINDIKELYPSQEIMLQHLQMEQHLKAKDPDNYKLTSVKIRVKNEKYKDLLSQIRKKFGRDYLNNKTIDLVIDINSLPLIQIYPENEKQS